MSKCFPKLTQTHVRIEVADGSSISVPMLPVSALGEMKECSEILKKVHTIEEFEALRLRLVALIKTVLPEPYCENLDRFDLTQLVEVVTYLMYGDNDDLPNEANAEKN